MAQLNDLLVLGNSNIIGSLKAKGINGASLNISGDSTLNGPIYIGQGDNNNIQLGQDGRINAGNTNATVCGMSQNQFLSGHSSYALTLRGSGARPTYNGNDLALYSDIGTRDDGLFVKVSGDTMTGNLTLEKNLIFQGSLVYEPPHGGWYPYGGVIANGFESIVFGQASHAEGYGSIAAGEYSHCEGMTLDSEDPSLDLVPHPGPSTSCFITADNGENRCKIEGDFAGLHKGQAFICDDKPFIIMDVQSDDSGNYLYLDNFFENDVRNKIIYVYGHVAAGDGSHVEGYVNIAYGKCSHAEGNHAYAIGECSHAEGLYTVTEGNYSHAEGSSTTASGTMSHAEGGNTKAIGDFSHVEGQSNTAEGKAAHAEGTDSKAYGEASHAEGMNTSAEGVGSHAEGFDTKAKNECSHAEGSQTIANGICSHAEGDETTANNYASHAEGTLTIANGQCSHAEGDRVHAEGKCSHAEGVQTIANGIGSHAEGWMSETHNTHSHAEGWWTKAYGEYSHSEGGVTYANGEGSHAEGGGTYANGKCSHAEGKGAKAEGECSHAEGYNTKAIGDFSHAEGENTEASGICSHAEGLGTVASGDYQLVIGMYNQENSDCAFIVGNGYNESSHSDAFLVKWDGNISINNDTFYTEGDVFYGGFWNDYAEFREPIINIKPGYCVVSSDSGKITMTSKRLQSCDGIVSDTFGFAIGKTDKCQIPLAVAGRVLAYCEGNRYDYHAGDVVCATAHGLVSKMTREEIKEWPDRIVGIVSEIPEYEVWSNEKVKVDNRIWIKIK